MTGTLCGQVAEVISPVADSAAVELVRLRSLEAKAVTVRTLSAQGESVDSAFAAIPPDLLVPPTPHPRTAPTPKPLASAGAPDTKEEHPGPHVTVDEAWEQSRAPAPAHGHMLEPPSMQGSGPGRRSPSPSRILPQPQGTPVSTSVAKAMAREAAQRVAENSRVRLGVFSLVPLSLGPAGSRAPLPARDRTPSLPRGHRSSGVPSMSAAACGQGSGRGTVVVSVPLHSARPARRVSRSLTPDGTLSELPGGEIRASAGEPPLPGCPRGWPACLRAGDQVRAPPEGCRP